MTENVWESKWTNNRTPWDQKIEVPILVQLTNEVYVKSNIKRVLVPGCGRGYDVLTLCKIPSATEVLGIDFAPTALEYANQLVEEQKDSHPELKKATFKNQDFFRLPNDEKFDLAFDYTFLCALTPDMREAWANKYQELIAKGGELFTLVFPLTNVNRSTEGGPFQIDYEIVKNLLEPRGFVNIENRPNEIAVASRKGNESIARWIKQ
jgi:protein-L-isoaspartate O-methyltransferase